MGGICEERGGEKALGEIAAKILYNFIKKLDKKFKLAIMK
jgi:hypothetical protein